MYNIWRLKRKVTTRRKAQGLKPIEDPNDIPDPNEQADYVSVGIAGYPFYLAGTVDVQG